MRLIDADTLFNHVYKEYGQALDEDPANLFMGWINEAPTIDPESLPKPHKRLASRHEGYNAIREEIREAKCEYKKAKKSLKDLENAIWIESDSMAVDAADQIDKAATSLVAEAMRVVATARKFKKTFGKRKMSDE